MEERIEGKAAITRALQPGFKDISDEQVRIYTFPGGDTLIIDEPQQIRISPSGNHRIVASNGRSYIVAPRWLSIEFKVRPGGKPFAF